MSNLKACNFTYHIFALFLLYGADWIGTCGGRDVAMGQRSLCTSVTYQTTYTSGQVHERL